MFRLGDRDFDIIEILPGKITAAFETSLASSILDKDATHGFGSRTKEVPARIPFLLPINIDKTNKDIMNQSCCLKGLPGWFFRQPLRRQLSQLVIN